MEKKIIVVLIAVVLLGAGYVTVSTIFAPQETNNPAKEETVANNKDEGVVCIQVITPARNPETGEIHEFPTPCDVPEGWEKIENDIPGLFLDIKSGSGM